MIRTGIPLRESRLLPSFADPHHALYVLDPEGTEFILIDDTGLYMFTELLSAII
jgi:hypothetical protein